MENGLEGRTLKVVKTAGRVEKRNRWEIRVSAMVLTELVLR